MRAADARCNCLNLNGVAAIKLEAAPRYHLQRFASHRDGMQHPKPAGYPARVAVTRPFDPTAPELALARCQRAGADPCRRLGLTCLDAADMYKYTVLLLDQGT